MRSRILRQLLMTPYSVPALEKYLVETRMMVRETAWERLDGKRRFYAAFELLPVVGIIFRRTRRLAKRISKNFLRLSEIKAALLFYQAEQRRMFTHGRPPFNLDAEFDPRAVQGIRGLLDDASMRRAVQLFRAAMALGVNEILSRVFDQYTATMGLAPNGFAPQAYLESCRRGLGRDYTCESLLHAAIEAWPAFPEARYAYAAILTARGDREGAIAQYRLAIKALPLIVPNSHDRDIIARCHYALGITLNDTGNSTEAMQCFRNAIDRCETFAEAHFQLALQLRALGQSFEAAAHFVRAARFQIVLPTLPKLPRSLASAP